MTAPLTEAEPSSKRPLIYRHSLLVRINHWVNVLVILMLLMSGLQIFNAHPALYWGEKSTFDDPLLRITAVAGPDGRPVGQTQIFGATFNTTGVLGLSTIDGRATARGFPSWATLPSYQSLAIGRRWHLFFAWLFVVNGVVYVAASLLSRHVWRDLVPSGAQLKGIGRSIWNHLTFNFEHGRDYNVLQKLSYLAIVFVILPLVILAGMAMSPGLDAAFPWLTDIFAGRQSARTIHFIAATLIVLFVLVHVIMVLITGVWNNMRSMITGRYAVDKTGGSHAD